MSHQHELPPPRYVIQPASASGHDCCFKFTVFDTQDAEAIAADKANGGPLPGRIPAKSICECYEENDARNVAAALNTINEAQQRLLASMPPEARAFLDVLREFVAPETKKPNAEGGSNVH